MATDKKVKVTVIPAGSDPNDPFNQVATYYRFEFEDDAWPVEPSPELRKVLYGPPTPQWMCELFDRVFAENKLRMRLRELRAKLTPEEWVELAEIERKLDEIKK